MIYKDFCGNSVSSLGLGMMRLPEQDGVICEQAALDLVDMAYRGGINYFDTAYMYHGEKSELFAGRALSRYPRDSFFLADKMPGSFLKETDTEARVAAIFEEQLQKCGVEYFDYYLLHNLSGGTYAAYTDPKKNVVRYLLKQKEAGRIKHLGLSSHATPEMLDEFLTRYPCLEFVQLQINYYDWSERTAKAEYEVARRHGKPVVIMEPCRGGRLASLTPEANAILKEATPQNSVASWAFRFAKQLEGVAVVLSGMSSTEQLADNLTTFCTDAAMTPTETQTLEAALAGMKAALSIPCTSCRYCDACPKGLDIPALLGLAQRAKFDAVWQVAGAYRKLPEDKRADACIGCGLCVKRCPQNIDTPKHLKELAGKMK